jgi:ribonuclease BN (tRNA processing enzyme)
LIHSTKCLGYRFTFDGRVISFCPDTGYSRSLVELSKDADLFIAECSWRPGQKKGVWPHLNPENAATVAKKANVKKLALLHFDADNYRTFEDRKEAEKGAKKIFKNVFATKDDMVFEL